jgi:hypothetical protein
LDSIEKDHEQFDLFLYDSLNDESDDDNEQFYDCSNDTILFKTITNERKLIEQLTRRCSSLDSLDSSKMFKHDVRALEEHDIRFFCLMWDEIYFSKFSFWIIL